MLTTLGTIFFIAYLVYVFNKRRLSAGDMSTDGPVYDEQPSYDYDDTAYEGNQPSGGSDQSFGEYFSYEAEQPAQSPHRGPKQAKAARPENTEAAPAQTFDDANNGVDFDLRQAVIAQTILHNDYIGDRY